MANALAITWPNTCHRLCIWHIYQNAAIHLSSVFARFTSFSKDFSSCIYDFEEEDEFLCAWDEMLDKYDLKTNEWLERMFKLREKWALVYGRQSFCADMTTTQRSESMNSVLKKYVSYKHNLLQFFHHFDRLIDERRYQELKADLRTCHSTPVAFFPVEILKHAASVYTHEVFELFQDELRKAYDSQIELCGEIGETSEYKITPFKKHHQHTVMYDSSHGNISCSCKKFEFAGILCSHALKVLSSRNIVKVPELYIKKRWTKKAKKSVVEAQPLGDSISASECVNANDEKKNIGVHYKELCSLYSQLVTRTALTDETFKLARTGILKMIEEVEVKLENMIAVSPNIGSKSTGKKALVSRVDEQRSVGASLNPGNAFDDVNTASSDILIKGWKNKEKNPVKSGKRPKSGLEKSIRRKRQKHNIISSSNSPTAHASTGNNEQV
ncbi:protein FAR-RED IMPAIRED RESPONSE 1 [Sesamum alatum]|uniref:Protein FAR1-RELATED SEQUENCE n=1 Tax=Sesamum alatum TaxID=300844 RepID=A0AAE1XYI9_9LAMI|nr:protein FAR-RED IMPAIRED RESPONSE 1 [Sesamum alatum]